MSYNKVTISKYRALVDIVATLCEVKTTKAKNVKTLPYGAFFGFTQNEEDLFKSKDNYRLCIVHTGLKEFYSMGYEEYLSLIQNKRVQYQINFRSE